LSVFCGCFFATFFGFSELLEMTASSFEKRALVPVAHCA